MLIVLPRPKNVETIGLNILIRTIVRELYIKKEARLSVEKVRDIVRRFSVTPALPTLAVMALGRIVATLRSPVVII